MAFQVPLGGQMDERRFPRRIDALGSIFEFVRAFFASRGLPEDPAIEVDIILEELFTNMVRHARGGGSDVAIGIGLRGADLTLVLRDFEVERFDVALDLRVAGEISEAQVTVLIVKLLQVPRDAAAMAAA